MFKIMQWLRTLWRPRTAGPWSVILKAEGNGGGLQRRGRTIGLEPRRGPDGRRLPQLGTELSHEPLPVEPLVNARLQKRVAVDRPPAAPRAEVRPGRQEGETRLPAQPGTRMLRLHQLGPTPARHSVKPAPKGPIRQRQTPVRGYQPGPPHGSTAPHGQVGFHPIPGFPATAYSRFVGATVTATDKENHHAPDGTPDCPDSAPCRNVAHLVTQPQLGSLPKRRPRTRGPGPPRAGAYGSALEAQATRYPQEPKAKATR